MSEQLVIVSNRLPVTVSKENGKLLFAASSGGLATAMSSLDIDASKRLWIGWPGIAADGLTASEKTTITRKLRVYGCHPVFLTQDQVDNFYGGYANDTLWPLFHYFQSYAQFSDGYWQAYRQVNTLFMKAVAKKADANAKIWVHDYHLMLLPGMLRRVVPKSSIGFFLHIPFPNFEIFRLLPNRKEILHGLLGADLVGFHTYDYARYFMSSVLRILGIENRHGQIIFGSRTVYVDSFPIGIDYGKFVKAANSEEVAEESILLKNHYRNHKLILSVDRLDYSKGIQQRLEAFEQLLKENPQLHKSVTLVVIAVPSRVDVAAYRNLRDTVEQTVSRINGTYATVDWTPISYQFQNQPFEQLVALYASADVALVTPIRDGMNLVAKEYVAAKQRTTGVLILSEMTGAVDELPEALRILPGDTNSIVSAMKRALKMPKAEQRTRMQLMQKRLSNYTVQRWANDFIEQLDLAGSSQDDNHATLLSLDQKKAMKQTFIHAKHRTLFLDYDGTLRNFVSSFNEKKAMPSKALRRLLSDLASVPSTDIYIISGRSREALELWFKDSPVSLIAEHGAWIKSHGSWQQKAASFEEYKQEIRPVLEHYADRTPGVTIEEKTFSLVWHYRNTPPELAYERTSSMRHELVKLLDGTNIGVYSGNKIIEVKPRTVSKGVAVKKIAAHTPADFILCIGDDYNDEDMFKALPKTSYTIKVGLGESNARFSVGSVDDVLSLLATLTSG